MASAEFPFIVDVNLDPLVGVLRELSNGQVMIIRRLTRIERALIDEGKAIMSELSDALAEVTAALDEHDAELSRLLSDFGARVNGKLDANEKEQFSEIVHRLAASDAVIESADPSAPATVPTSDSAPADGIGNTTGGTVQDGAQGVGTVGQGGDPTAVDSGQPIV
jgi:ABC-type transporter Mla subunit MlaD